MRGKGGDEGGDRSVMNRKWEEMALTYGIKGEFSFGKLAREVAGVQGPCTPYPARLFFCLCAIIGTKLPLF